MEFRLEAFFLHKRLLLAILSPDDRDRIEAASARSVSDPLGDLLVETAFSEAAVHILAGPDVKPLRELLIHDEAKAGLLTWDECAFYFKSAEAFQKFEEGNRSARAQFHTNIEEFRIVVGGTFSPEHMVGAASAKGHLSGQKPAFVLGYIESLGQGELTLRPLLIGRRVIGRFGLPIRHSLYVAPQQIREFSKLESVDPRKADARVLEDIPERTIKQWFAEIIGEPYVTKDWGGELSDLWTTRLTVDDEPLRAAFLFKGPAAFRPMVIADLGKNGDQIDRLFKEPADIAIVQHCHHIRSEVVNMMEVYASDFRRTRRFSTIDGIVTSQILRAYGKI